MGSVTFSIGCEKIIVELFYFLQTVHWNVKKVSHSFNVVNFGHWKNRSQHGVSIILFEFLLNNSFSSINPVLSPVALLKSIWVLTVDEALKCREWRGLPWGFPGQPAPVPVETRTRERGCGFSQVRVMSLIKPMGSQPGIWVSMGIQVWYKFNIFKYTNKTT